MQECAPKIFLRITLQYSHIGKKKKLLGKYLKYHDFCVKG